MICMRVEQVEPMMPDIFLILAAVKVGASVDLARFHVWPWIEINGTKSVFNNFWYIKSKLYVMEIKQVELMMPTIIFASVKVGVR